MKPIEEMDHELLEAYLDDALTPAQVQQVAQRLGAEPELAEAMHELRARRAMRLAAWRSMQPAEAQVDDVILRVARRVRRQAFGRRAFRVVRVGAAVAAAIVVFCAGWLTRGSANSGLQAHEAPAVGINRVHPTRATISMSPASGPFQVTLRDQGGQVISVQRFAAADEAREFAQNVMQFEARRAAARQGSAMLVSDRF